MVSQPAALDRRRPMGMPTAVMYVGIPAYVGAVGFSLFQIAADNSRGVLALAMAAIGVFTALLLWLEVQAPVPATETLRLRLVIALGTIALGLLPLGGPAVMYVMTVSGVAGHSLRPRPALAAISLCGAEIAVIGIVNHFLIRETFQSVVIALVVGLFTFGGKRMIDTNEKLGAAREELADLAVVNERLRIARDLHDLLGHSLTVIRAKSELASRLGTRDPERAAKEMAEVESIARQSLVDVREAVSSYRRPTLAGERANARVALAAAGIEADFDDESVALSPETDETLAWVLREAVTNVVRHSGAMRCRVRTVRDGDVVRLEIVDEGSGLINGNHDNGSGLAGLRERLASVGGTLEVSNAATGGVGVVARVPAHR